MKAMAQERADEHQERTTGRRRMLAKWLSALLDPRVLAWPVILAAAFRGVGGLGRSLPWAGLVISLAILPVLFLLGIDTARGRLADSQAPDRRSRNRYYLASAVGMTVCLGLLVILHGPRTLVALLTAMLASALVAALCNTRWKVSVHTGSAAGAGIAIGCLYGPLGWLALLLTPIVGWTRVEMGRHTPAQVWAGGVIGGSVTLAVFRLMLG